MPRLVDYPAEGTPVGRCVILPGRSYTPDGPLLYFAARVAAMHGWDVRQVWWELEAAPRFSASVEEEIEWVGARLEAAVDGYDGQILVVAKSLGTLGASFAAERGDRAAWLTPLLTEPAAAAPLLRYPADQFVLIGDADPYLDRAVLDSLPGEHHVVPGDHGLEVPGDPAAMVASHDLFVRAFDTWLADDR
jgi:hypothetical protein